jgi:hypothetical protein
VTCLTAVGYCPVLDALYLDQQPSNSDVTRLCVNDELLSWLRVTEDGCGTDGLYLWGPLKGLFLLCESSQRLRNVSEAGD